MLKCNWSHWNYYYFTKECVTWFKRNIHCNLARQSSKKWVLLQEVSFIKSDNAIKKMHLDSTFLMDFVFIPTKPEIELFHAYLLSTERNRVHQRAMLFIIYLFWTNSQSTAEHKLSESDSSLFLMPHFPRKFQFMKVSSRQREGGKWKQKNEKKKNVSICHLEFSSNSCWFD